MSGILGILNATGRMNIHQYLQDSISQLSHFSWHVSDHWVAPDGMVGLGRSGIGVFNRESQPVMSADGNLVMFMTGELYRIDALQKHLTGAGFVPRNASHAELALTAFQAYSADFAKRLEGVFLLAIYDIRRRRLTIANDRFGLYPLYYAHQPGKLTFAPEVKAVLRAPFVERKLNLVAVAEYVRFQQLLGVKTFHEGILQFPYASIGEFDLSSGCWELRHYWDWDEVADRNHLPYDEAVSETGRLLRQAIHRLTSNNDLLRPGVFLSGGLDSRMIIGMIPPRTSPIISATYGIEDCRDVYYAERIAQTVGV